MQLKTTCLVTTLALALTTSAAAQTSPSPAPTTPVTQPAPVVPPAPIAQAAPQPAPSRSTLSPLSTAGLTMFGLGYMPSLAIGVGYLVIIYPFQYLISENNPEPALLWLMVPAVGPFFGARTEILRGEHGWQAFYVGLGVVQSVGLLLWATALFDDRDPPPTPAPRAGLHLGIANGGPALSITW